MGLEDIRAMLTTDLTTLEININLSTTIKL